MSCPLHPTAPVTQRPVPVEVYPQNGKSAYRLGGAQMETCDQCGASYYDWDAVAKLPAQALGQGQAPPKDNWDC